MGFLELIWAYFVNNFLTQPTYFIGLLVIIGYMLMKKPFHESCAGFIKAVVGYKILTVGSGGLSSTFKPIIAALQDKFNLSAIVLDTYMGQAAAQSALEAAGKSFSQAMLLLLFAFVFNLLLVKFQKYTKMRAVFTTGHIQTQQATIAFWFIFTCFPQLGDWPLMLIMSVLLGLYWAVGSNLTVEVAQNLTDGAGFCVAHQQMFGIAIWSAIGYKFFKGKDGKVKRLEDYELPGWLSIFNEDMVSTALLMTLFFAVILLVLGKDYLVSAGMLGEGKSFLFYILDTSLAFAVYLSILKLGVRTFVGELTASFQGIQSKLLPGAIVGVDCAAGYGFGSENAVTFGFMFGALGQFLAIIGLILFKSPVLAIAGFVPVFFDNATIAIYVNAKAGAKAAMVTTFFSGILQVVCSVIAAMAFTYNGIGVVEFGGYMAMFDWAVIWPIFTFIMKYLSYIGVAIVILVLVMIPQLQYKKDPEGYFLCVSDYEAYKEHMKKKEAAAL